MSAKNKEAEVIGSHLIVGVEEQDGLEVTNGAFVTYVLSFACGLGIEKNFAYSDERPELPFAVGDWIDVVFTPDGDLQVRPRN